jgi:CRP-like cAMP-binding protein
MELTEIFDLDERVQKIARGIKKKFPNLSQDTLLELFRYTKTYHVPKKEYLMKSGQFDKRIVFVLKGLFSASILKDGVERTVWFRQEFDVFASYTSIFYGKPSNTSYQAIEDSGVLVIDYDWLRQKAMEDQEIGRSIIVVLEDVVAELIGALEDQIVLSPEERFLSIMEHRPELITRVPQNQLASFLGITPVSLSRLKSRVKNKGN